MRLRTTDNAKAVEVLSALEWTGEVRMDGESVVVEAPNERSSELSVALGRSEVYVTEMTADEMSLESVPGAYRLRTLTATLPPTR